jgi:hypothetical protein
MCEAAALVMLDGPHPRHISPHAGTGLENATDRKAAAIVGNVGDRISPAG